MTARKSLFSILLCAAIPCANLKADPADKDPSKQSDDAPKRKMDLKAASREIMKFYAAEIGREGVKDAKLAVSEYEIKGLWKELGMQLFRLKRGSFASWNYIHADGKLEKLGIPTHGGAGLMDYAVYEKALYLTSDWGSGILRTALYKVSRDKKRGIRTEELGVISSVGGKFDKAFMEEEAVKKVMTLLQPLKRGKAKRVKPRDG